MKDLKVTVDKVVAHCGAKLTPGDSFYVRGRGRLELPPGKTFCMYAIQSAIPFCAAKQREDDLTDSDWVPRTTHTCCPDPDGIVMKVEAI
jgi:anaerobic carbon-monoxide dehydrogenase iron sulfur subunit